MKFQIDCDLSNQPNWAHLFAKVASYVASSAGHESVNKFKSINIKEDEIVVETKEDEKSKKKVRKE